MVLMVLMVLCRAAVLGRAIVGATPIELCKAGDLMIEEKVSKIFNKKASQGPHPCYTLLRISISRS
jgi:hypothetical protein